MEQDQQLRQMRAEMKRLSDDMEFILRVMTDPEFTKEDREFYLGTHQALKEVEKGKVTTYSEKQFKERWGTP